MSLNIAVIGAGRMGGIHVEKLSCLEDVHIIGIVDIDRRAAEDLAHKHGIPSFHDYADICGKVDGVVVATPTKTHYRIAKDLLENGSHVFIEKPIASNQEQARELIELARKKRLILQIGHLERFNPAFTTALSFIRKPILIDARRASAFTGRSIDIDVVLDLMIHDIDLILSLVKEEVREVKAQGVSFIMDKLDMVSARIEFKNGCIANLTANRISPRKERLLTIFEKEQCVLVDLLNCSLVSSAKKSEGTLATEEQTVDRRDAVAHELAAFAESIVNSTEPIVSGEDGLKALILADQIKRYIAERTF